MLHWSMTQREHPVAIRVPACGVLSDGKAVTKDFGKLNTYEVTQAGSDVAFIGLGSFYPLAQQAAAEYEKRTGVRPTVINPYYITGLDKELLAQLRQPVAVPSETPAPSLPAQSVVGEAAFQTAVERAKAYITEGDIMQVVLSQRMTKPFTASPLALYRSLQWGKLARLHLLDGRTLEPRQAFDATGLDNAFLSADGTQVIEAAYYRRAVYGAVPVMMRLREQAAATGRLFRLRPPVHPSLRD